MSDNQRLLQIEGLINFRDLGGYLTRDGATVQWGKVYRSAQLDRLSPNGIRDLAAMNIQTVVDLRFSDETELYPTIQLAVPDAEILSWRDTPDHKGEDEGDMRSRAMQLSWRSSLESQDPVQVREAMRSNYPKKLYSHRAIYRAMLIRLQRDNTPLLFHCAAGKDRTGVAAALILALLDVPRETIVEDYLITQSQTQHLMDAWLTGGATDEGEREQLQSRLGSYSREVVQPIFDADEAYIATLLDYVDENYGGFHEYAYQQLDLSDADIDLLRQNLLA
ncbi:MAG: tyrosine-protein phosphatase [Gammaproteobacteria bacterium]|nr:tyrosine-protein phosphatase [Gammaproteobacteria bacterium]